MAAPQAETAKKKSSVRESKLTAILERERETDRQRETERERMTER